MQTCNLERTPHSLLDTKHQHVAHSLFNSCTPIAERRGDADASAPDPLQDAEDALAKYLGSFSEELLIVARTI